MGLFVKAWMACKGFIHGRGCMLLARMLRLGQCDRKKSPNFYKSCPKMIDFDTFTKNA